VQETTTRHDQPSVALIIAAYNEEEIIAEKIENSLQLDYPENELNIIVFSDASDDRTDEIIKQYQNEGVSLVRIQGRVGKTECQNRVADLVDDEILVFSDANSMYEPDAVSELVSGFTQGVGCVAGELRYRESSEVEGESVYWRYESWIKRLESRFYSLVAGNGSIYAVRAKSYVPQPADAISDFTEPLSIVQNGEQVRYMPSATAWEETEASSTSELQRRIRIITRSWNSIVRFKNLLSPLQDSKFAYQLWSHKLSRWLSPVLLISVFVFSIALGLMTEYTAFDLVILGQSIFYTLALIGWFADRSSIEDPVITHVPFYFLQANYGMLLGLISFLQGKNVVVWDTSSRNN
jgi:cellulose synthase/poly-beta-1,6-N-acetylglucosamine synthase-like glycosyltransferase